LLLSSILFSIAILLTQINNSMLDRGDGNRLAKAFCLMLQDPDYLHGVEQGVPRRGHPEGCVKLHIAELLENEEFLLRYPETGALTQVQLIRHAILIHAHDTFKFAAKSGTKWDHPANHASLAREFVGRYTEDGDLLSMIQRHDQPYALFRMSGGVPGAVDRQFDDFAASIRDWDTFALFQLTDNVTPGKDHGATYWLVEK
jgi:hypothetical protein